MTSAPAAKPRPAILWARARGVLAGTAAIGFLAIAVAAPFTGPTRAAAEVEFYERIHQQFVPEDVENDAINLAISPSVKIEKPKPEPQVVSDPETPASPPSPPKYTGGGSPAEWMAAAGIAESDWGYVDYIVTRESGWNPNAMNASSGACGLVQALPCSKVPGNGLDPVDNLKWATSYANTCVPGRMYCGWKGAYDFWVANHWW